MEKKNQMVMTERYLMLAVFNFIELKLENRSISIEDCKLLSQLCILSKNTKCMYEEDEFRSIITKCNLASRRLNQQLDVILEKVRNFILKVSNIKSNHVLHDFFDDTMTSDSRFAIFKDINITLENEKRYKPNGLLIRRMSEGMHYYNVGLSVLKPYLVAQFSMSPVACDFVHLECPNWFDDYPENSKVFTLCRNICRNLELKILEQKLIVVLMKKGDEDYEVPIYEFHDKKVFEKHPYLSGRLY